MAKTMKTPQFKPVRREGSKFELTSNKKETGRTKGYDVKWEKYRRRFLHHNTLCYCCGNKATVVDHIIAFKKDDTLFRELTNHMPMCASCHSTVTGLFDRQSVPDTEGKVKWIEKKREYCCCQVKIKVLTRF